MTSFPRLQYSLQDVRKAGEALKGDLKWTPENEAEIRAHFAIANNFRESHALPMQKIRTELIGKMNKHKLRGLTFARLKRMHSIRRKLGRMPVNLIQLQDVGGCRAIVPSITNAAALVGALRLHAKHELYRESDYITSPKVDGYRSHHLMFKFCGTGETEQFDKRRVEVQVRTRLQHSWATAVEAVGTFLGQNMKAGAGDTDWLRLFLLMAAELATAEKCDPPPGVPTSERERRKELRDLNDKLTAVEKLEGWRQAVRYSEIVDSISPRFRWKYYLVTMNNITKEVDVRGHHRAIDGAESLNFAEQLDNRRNSNEFNTVLVQADKMQDLKDGYPNYFGDVHVFAKSLRDVVKGKQAKEFTMPPKRHPSAYRPGVVPDTSWFRRYTKPKVRMKG